MDYADLTRLSRINKTENDSQRKILPIVRISEAYPTALKRYNTG